MKKYVAIIFMKKLAIIALIILFGGTTKANVNDSLHWTPVLSPINYDIKQIHFFTPETAVANGKQLLILNNGHWEQSKEQPPTDINILFSIDEQSLVMSSNTKFQESELFIKKNNQWGRIWNPMANVINSIYFSDFENGVIAGLGEIALLKKGQWEILPPPTKGTIKSVFIDSNSILWALSISEGLFKYDGKWKKIPHSESIRFIKHLQNTIYVLGKNYLGSIDTSDSLIKISENEDLKNISSFTMISSYEAIAVGHLGLILRYRNSNWKQEKSKTTENLNDICVLKDGDAWISGDHGIILHYSSLKEDTPFTNDWKGFKKTYFHQYAKVIDDEYGVVAADFNKDGLIDIFSCGLFEANHLYINNGSNLFTNKAQRWNVTGDESTQSRDLNLGACAGDLDNDEDTDLYVTVLNGKNRIYKNIRGKYFVDYSDISHGIGEQTDRSNSSILGDVDNDGDLDIFIANENCSNRLFLNNGAGIFTEVTKTTELETQGGGTGCSFADIDDDGDLDLYVSNWSGYNILYKNLLQESGQLKFINITKNAGVEGEIFSKSNAVVFADIDNDADLDLFVTNRKTSNKLYLNNGKGEFTDVTAEYLGIDSLKSYGAVIADFDNDGYVDIYISNVGKNVLYMNINGIQFSNKTQNYGADFEGYSTGSAAVDINNDGYTDLYIANYLEESSAILLNINNDKAFIKIKINGIQNNWNAIGTKLYVYKENGLDQLEQLICFREISGGSGYASMNQRFLPIAVPDQKFVDIKVVFPNGIIKTLTHQAINNTLIIEDVSGFLKHLLTFKRRILLLVKDPHMFLKTFTWLFVLLLIIINMFYGLKNFKWSGLYSVGLGFLLLFLFYIQFDHFEYKNLLFSTLLPAISVILLIFLIHLYYGRKRIETMAITEQEQIREKLSRDLHDDLASTVSTIAIYLTLIRYNLNNKEKKLNDLLDKTSSLVSDAVSSITDLIWAINPKSESLEDLIIRIKNNFSTVFHEKGIHFNTSCEGNIEKYFLASKVKQNVYLIIKEALNNTLKYASATEVSMLIRIKEHHIHIILSDNGKGFEISKVKNKGHGLTNMHIRAEDINAHFEINSIIGKGTEIHFFFKTDTR